MKSQLVLLAALIAGPALAQDAPAGNIVNGENHFLSDGCWQCHGVGGNGAALTGPKLSRTQLSFEQFLHQLRQPAAEMAPYEAAILSDATAADIYAYIKSRPASPDAKDLPLLQGMGVK